MGQDRDQVGMFGISIIVDVVGIMEHSCDILIAVVGNLLGVHIECGVVNRNRCIRIDVEPCFVQCTTARHLVFDLIDTYGYFQVREDMLEG